MKKREFILYDLSNYKEIIEDIIKDLNVFDYYFDIKLILTEALTNAYKHGNNENNDKSIYLRYFYENNDLKFEIEDCGEGNGNIIIPDKISENNVLDISGRGLFLINSIADSVVYRENTLVIQKHMCY